tara:strand:+ start:1307 stop:2278 length:972 start_codon:yes stop_codon:yes gene_type:complete
MKKILFINLLGIIVLFLALEMVLRFVFSYNVQGVSDNLINTKLDFRFNNPKLVNGKAFGETIYTDKNGFRIDSTKNSKKIDFNERQNILFVGGSVTFGAGIKAENTFVEKLNLNSKYNVKNASVFGSNLENNLKIIKKFYKKNETKKIFINFSLDDITSDMVDFDIESQHSVIHKIKINSIISKIKNFLRSRSVIFTFAKGIILDPQLNFYLYDLNLYNNKELLMRQKITLQKLKKLINDKNIIYFYSLPYAAQVRKENCFKKDIGEIIIEKNLKANNFNYISFKKDFCLNKKPKNLFLRNDPAHLSKEGHNFTFNLLKEYID